MRGGGSLGKRSRGPAAGEGGAPVDTVALGGPGHPAGRRGTDTTPFPGDHSLRLAVSPGGGQTHPGGRDRRVWGRRTSPRPRRALSQSHTPGTEQRTEARSVPLPGLGVRCVLRVGLPSPSLPHPHPARCPAPRAPRPPVLSREMRGLRLSEVGDLPASIQAAGAGRKRRQERRPDGPTALRVARPRPGWRPREAARLRPWARAPPPPPGEGAERRGGARGKRVPSSRGARGLRIGSQRPRRVHRPSDRSPPAKVPAASSKPENSKLWKESSFKKKNHRYLKFSNKPTLCFQSFLSV